jgi:hypothetical protein
MPIASHALRGEKDGRRKRAKDDGVLGDATPSAARVADRGGERGDGGRTAAGEGEGDPARERRCERRSPIACAISRRRRIDVSLLAVETTTRGWSLADITSTSSIIPPFIPGRGEGEVWMRGMKQRCGAEVCKSGVKEREFALAALVYRR